MIQKVQLTGGARYHIYDRGNNREVIFREHVDYLYFLKLLQKYVLPVATIYCYSLLRNHFHLLVKIKPYDFQSNNGRPLRAGQAFSNLFNAYAKYFNLKYNRIGKLFSENFKRKEIMDDFYFTQLVYYVHSNPQRHRLVKDFRSYPYSSYRSVLSLKDTLIDAKQVLDWFGGRVLFEQYHALEQQSVLGYQLFEDDILKLNT